MNPCVKTGVVFTDAKSGATFTGDLFYPWQVRGIPARDGLPIGIQDSRRVHIVVDGAEYSARPLSGWVDTNVGIKVKPADPEFIEYLRIWYPELEPEIQQWTR